MDGIRARIRARFSKGKSGSSASTPTADTAKDGLKGPRDQQASPGYPGPAGRRGVSSQADSVVETRCNSQQAAHRRTTEESAASVTTASAATSGGARSITAASSTDRPRQSPVHDSRRQDLRIGGSHHGISPRSAAHDPDESLDSTASSFSFSSSHFLEASESQLPLNTNPEPVNLDPGRPSLLTPSHAAPRPAVGLCHENGPAAEPDLLGQDAATVAKIIITPTSSMSAASAQAPADPQASLLRALLQVSQGSGRDDAPGDASAAAGARPEYRKIWVKRPSGSATLISLRADALVDDLRDLILRKYSNSIGRHFDSPDLHLHITPRDKRPARPLGPEEVLAETLDSLYPGGQTVDDALVILVPQPHARPSPRPPAPQSGAAHYPSELGLPSESGEGYFPPVVPASATVPHPAGVGNDPSSHAAPAMPPGQAPAVPSPGSSRAQAFTDRPRLGRSHTPSPAVQSKPPPVPNPNEPHPPVPAPTSHPLKPAAADAAPTAQVSTPPARTSSPRPSKKKARKTEKQLPPVPPINVLLVEDNPINLKLLEAFAKGLKVRWQSAMNGQDAVTKWRSGGFHLVLMDIQLPVMNGLEATREIRRLERENSIGVFTSSTGKAPGEEGEMKEEDRLANIEMFKSPVIIVALTASSLQSDRHEALAAGCNDFLTKPVSFPWLETKVREWGCMQALIDFEGWRTWKNFSQEAEEKEAAKKKGTTPVARPRGKKSRPPQVPAVS